MPLSSVLSWKDFFLSSKHLDSSNGHLIRIKASVGPSIPFLTSFEEISKNPGISFLSLDPSKSQLQLFHHGTIIGGLWSSPTKHLVSVLALDQSAKPIQIVEKSIRMWNINLSPPKNLSLDWIPRSNLKIWKILKWNSTIRISFPSQIYWQKRLWPYPPPTHTLSLKHFLPKCTTKIPTCKNPYTD